MSSPRSRAYSRRLLVLLIVLMSCWLPAHGAATSSIPVVSRLAGSATITTNSGASHELGSVERLQSGSTLDTALDSIVSVHLEQVGQVQLGPQTKTSVSVRDGWLSFKMTGGSLCVDSQSQNVSVNAGSLHLAVSSPSTIYDVMLDRGTTTIAVFRGGIVVGGSHMSTKTIYAGGAVSGPSDGMLSDVTIASVVNSFAKLKCPDATIVSEVLPATPPPVASGGGHSGTIIGTLLGLAAIAAAVGHGGGGGSATNAPPGSVQVAPTTLSFGDVGSSNSKSFAVTESNYGGSFTIDGSACSGTASVNPASGVTGQTFVVTPLAAGGPCNIRVSDDHGGSANVTVAVGPFGAVTPNMGSVNLRVGGSSSAISVSETGYSGVFTAAASGCGGIATITPASGTSFNVSPVAAGNCRITFSDDHGQSTPAFAFVIAGTMLISPQTLQLSGAGDSNNFIVSDSSATTFSAISSNLAVATVTLIASTATAATFKVTAVLGGKATIAVTDTLGGAGNVSVGVGQAPLAAKRHVPFTTQPQLPVAHPVTSRAMQVPQRERGPAVPGAAVSRGKLLAITQSVYFARVGLSQLVTMTELGYTGALLVTSSDPKVATVSQVLGAGDVRTVIVSSSGVGRALIRITDDHGGKITVTVTVPLVTPRNLYHSIRP